MSIPFKSDIELNKIVSNDLDLEINGLKLNGSTGTEGQVLTSTGSGAPIWSTVSGGGGEETSGTTTNSLTITLNGVSTSFNGSIERNLTLYAPTNAGTDGYLLQSNGSGEPSWKAISDSTAASALTSSSTAIPTVRDIYNGLPYINGSHSYTRSTYIYAPISVGTSGQILQSDGSGAPIWVDASSIGGGGGGDTTGTTSASLTISLNGNSSSFNGSTARSYSFYAPTTSGSTGQLLQSNTNSAPTWRSISDSSSASSLSALSTSIPTVRDIYYGLPYINGTHSYTSNTDIYAPTSGGTNGYILQANGSTSTPTWTPRRYLHALYIETGNFGGSGQLWLSFYFSSTKKTKYTNIVELFNDMQDIGWSNMESWPCNGFAVRNGASTNVYKADSIIVFCIKWMGYNNSEGVGIAPWGRDGENNYLISNPTAGYFVGSSTWNITDNVMD